MKSFKHVAVTLFLMTLVLCSSALGQVSTSKSTKTTSLLLVGHGSVATDFPRLSEYFKLRRENIDEARKIKEDMAHWPRNEQNDKYWAGIVKIAREIERAGVFRSVQFAFNEMCAPTVESALAELMKERPDTIIVTSIMITPGGSHSEKDIPRSIQSFKEQHPDIGTVVIYAWPYDIGLISSLVIEHVRSHIQRN